MKRLLVILLILIAAVHLFANPVKKVRTVNRITEPPKIDGVLDDEAWKALPDMNNFIQYYPYNRRTASQKTDIKIGYDNTALYISACLYFSAF